ncbi:hypothetical protein [Allohahella marinimesophila]|uniref:Uncharacterized protein n=1 Tax=Allohahella marinimesophila TaxID=1054972 RepID=A0ABP7PQC7_9GAMM
MSNFESAINDLSEQFRALTQRIEQSLQLIGRSQGSAFDKTSETPSNDSDQLIQLVGDLDESINTAVARFAAVVSVQEAHQPSGHVRDTAIYQDAYEALSELAKQFSILLAAVQGQQQEAAKSAGTARKRHNAAQRYLDSSGYY